MTKSQRANSLPIFGLFPEFISINQTRGGRGVKLEDKRNNIDSFGCGRDRNVVRGCVCVRDKSEAKGVKGGQTRNHRVEAKGGDR